MAHRLSTSSREFADLASRHFVTHQITPQLIRLLAERYRLKKSFLAGFTKLHIFVVTLRCDHSCPYCQVSRRSLDAAACDMSLETADRSIDLMFQSPADPLTMEFQGGEPLANWDLVSYMIRRAASIAGSQGRKINFVVATNLSLISAPMLQFCKDYDVSISTSLDGPEFIHNANRPLPGGNSYQAATRGIGRAKMVLGPSKLSALMTTTRLSLRHPEEIVDEYLRQGFRSIFFRPMRSYGFASKTSHSIGYNAEEFIKFYKRGLEHVLSLNRQGIDFQEVYAKIILARILTPFSTGYVDLQSPSSLAIGVVVYNYDGDVYASDESRMLAEMGNRRFRLGNAHADSYKAIFLTDALTSTLHASCTETLPGCADCVFQAYCGADPVYHHTVQGDLVGHRPTSDFHKINFSIIRLIFQYLLDGDPEIRRILVAWAVDKGVSQVRPEKVLT